MSLRFASHFQKDDELWVKFKLDGYFNKESFEKLLLRASMVLTESEVEKVFNDIDTSGKGTITKLEMYSRETKSHVNFLDVLPQFRFSDKSRLGPRFYQLSSCCICNRSSESISGQ